jgi:hypothetical protein
MTLTSTPKTGPPGGGRRAGFHSSHGQQSHLHHPVKSVSGSLWEYTGVVHNGLYHPWLLNRSPLQNSLLDNHDRLCVVFQERALIKPTLPGRCRPTRGAGLEAAGRAAAVGRRRRRRYRHRWRSRRSRRRRRCHGRPGPEGRRHRAGAESGGHEESADGRRRCEGAGVGGGTGAQLGARQGRTRK